MKISNFGQNVTLAPNVRYTPDTEQEVLAILDKHRGAKIRCIGRMHSWSQVLESDDVLLDLRNLNSATVDSSQERVVVHAGAGCQIKKLLADLKAQGNWTLPSVGFVTEQTIAGAVSTSTHGSGRNSLSHYVHQIRVARYNPITGKAEIAEITQGEELRAARCSLGCLGVIVSVTMECRPDYLVEESFREHLTLSSVLECEKEYELQQFYLIPWRWTYFGQHRKESDQLKSSLFPVYQWYRFLTVDILLHLLIIFFVRIVRLNAPVRVLLSSVLPLFVIRNWKTSGPANKQLVMEHELFRHVETEIFVQKSRLHEALDFAKKTLTFVGTSGGTIDDALRGQLESANCLEELQNLKATYCHHFPICVRRILPDDTLISMTSSTRKDSSDGENEENWYAISFINYQRGTNRQAFERLAAFLGLSMKRLFHARPHWGKICRVPTSELIELYPSFEAFRRICETWDPNKVFRNQWTDELLTSTHELAGTDPAKTPHRKQHEAPTDVS